MTGDGADPIDRIEAALGELRHAAYGFYGPGLRAAFQAPTTWHSRATHYRVLRMIEATRLTPPTISELAGGLLSDAARASRIVTDLQRDGLVDRTVGRRDRRRREVVLTDAGREVLAQARRSRARFVEVALRDWDASAAAELAELLERFNAAVRHVAPCWAIDPTRRDGGSPSR